MQRVTVGIWVCRVSPVVSSKHGFGMSSQDAHYAGNLVDGARMLALFGDLATELLIRLDGDEGLFRAYESVEFLAPVFGGDYIEAVGRITRVGNTSRTMEFEARKVIRPLPPEKGRSRRVLGRGLRRADCSFAGPRAPA